MIVTKKAISRRTILRGVGATIALPLLDAMVPALTAAQNTPARPVRRLGVVYHPNGVVYENWLPTGTADQHLVLLLRIYNPRETDSSGVGMIPNDRLPKIERKACE